MPAIVITADQLGAAIRKRLQEDTSIVRAAAVEAVQQGLRDAVRATDRAGAVDQGLFKGSWMARAIPLGGVLENTAPYAAVIEYGRRPNRPGPPLAPIYAWVQRKFRGQITAEYRVARALALGLARGAAGSKSFRAAAVRHVRQQFGSQERAVNARALALAMSIRDAIHYRGTRPRRILGSTMPTLKMRFTREAMRRLKARK